MRSGASPSALTGALSATGDPIKILIVDDSIVARTVLTRILEAKEGFEIVGSVANAAEALDLVGREAVDIILLDLEMPGVGGLDALPLLIERSNGARVLVVSSSAADGAVATIQALALGAADTLQKPGVANFVGRFLRGDESPLGVQRGDLVASKVET